MVDSAETTAIIKEIVNEKGYTAISGCLEAEGEGRGGGDLRFPAIDNDVKQLFRRYYPQFGGIKIGGIAGCHIINLKALANGILNSILKVVPVKNSGAANLGVAYCGDINAQQDLFQERHGEIFALLFINNLLII
jgi:hypothetical protein